MSDEKTLISEIIQYLEVEREIFGDFQLMSTPDLDSSQPNATGKNKSMNADSNMDKQEGLFTENSNSEIFTKLKSCKTLKELETLCENADVLKTDLENTNLVFGVGNPQADLMLIGEAPGAEEDKQGEPFVGAAGQLLNKILEAVNFSRNDVYIANILKHRPPNNRNPNPEERKHSLPFLLRQIDLIEPKIILALGKVSAQTLLDNDNTLGSMREKFHSFRDYELMATYHPAALLRRSKWKRPTWEDMQLLRERYDELDGTP
jgi:DNA polymerase